MLLIYCLYTEDCCQGKLNKFLSYTNLIVFCYVHFAEDASSDVKLQHGSTRILGFIVA